MTQAKHTPTPWKKFDVNGVIAIMRAGTENEVVHWTGFDGSKYDDRTNRANAALIVSACNSHKAAQQLADAVEAMKPFMWEPKMEGETPYEVATKNLWKKLNAFRRSAAPPVKEGGADV